MHDEAAELQLALKREERQRRRWNVATCNGGAKGEATIRSIEL